jgi:endonuclease/exonuclease/phosphatase family metal-dependent hydrolase
MILKIFNLNLWNYTDWKQRKPKIIRIIKKYNPDTIIFQEIRDDVRFNKKGDNQLKQLNRALRYPHYAFYQVTDKRKGFPEKYKQYCVEGTGILSRFPILKIERKQLKKHKDDKYICGNLYARIKAEKPVDIVAVHFSNTDLFSKLHLIETLKYIKAKKIKPIIIGDFNMWRQNVLHKLTGKDYKSSIKLKKYLSYPIRKWTLDYILIPKEFEFKSLKCLNEKLSDHRALLAEVEI